MLLTAAANIFAQSTDVVVIGANQKGDPNATLEVVSKNGTAGFMPPRVSTLQMTALQAKLNTDSKGLMVFNTDENCLKTWLGTSWSSCSAGTTGVKWDVAGNSGTTPGINFIGTTDNQDLVFKRYNVFSGIVATWNTGLGYYALMSNTTGTGNSAFGSNSLHSNTTGTNNLAVGNDALTYNTTGSQNVAIGSAAGISIKTASFNIAVGNSALSNNVSGESNVGVGVSAGEWYVTSSGGKPLVDISNSIFIGNNTMSIEPISKNQIVIGDAVVGKGSNTVQIGNSKITRIGGKVAWSNDADSRLCNNIITSTYGLNFITKLRPVNYSWYGVNGSGFIGQEVEAAANDIGYDFDGIVKPKNTYDYYSLRYATFVVPLVKAVQEQQAQIESLQQQINDLKTAVEALTR